MDHYLTKVASLGSPGGDELRWVKPVRPGDTLSVRVTVLKTVPSKSKPDRGAITSFVEVINQANEVYRTATDGFCQGHAQERINEQIRTIAAQLTQDERHAVAVYYGAGGAVRRAER
jgi:hypothetical protein